MCFFLGVLLSDCNIWLAEYVSNECQFNVAISKVNVGVYKVNVGVYKVDVACSLSSTDGFVSFESKWKYGQDPA